MLELCYYISFWNLYSAWLEKFLYKPKLQKKLFEISAGDGQTCSSNILDFRSFNGKSTSFIAVGTMCAKWSVLGDFDVRALCSSLRVIWAHELFEEMI